MGRLKNPSGQSKYSGTEAKQKQMTNTTETEQCLQSRCSHIHMYN